MRVDAGHDGSYWRFKAYLPEGQEDGFDSLPWAMFTLFQLMTMDSWAYTIRPLIRQKPALATFFFLFISVSALVLSNLITAVIVENALTITKQDEEQRLRGQSTKFV